MFRNFLLSLLFLSAALPATIIETSHIEDVAPLIDAETWFLVDLDNTFFEAAQALGHAHWFYEQVQNRCAQGMSREEAFEDFYPLWVKTQQACPVKPLEESFVSCVLELQKKGVVVMGLTHRQPSVASATFQQVTSLGVDFSKTAPSSELQLHMEAKHPTLYQNGILFVHDLNKKGTVFLDFLGKMAQRPKKVVFIDDKRKNVEELEEVLALENISYVGVHYTAIEQTKKIYDPAIAEIQLKCLTQILSNEAAALLNTHGF